MGRTLGKLPIRVSGIISYGLSPYEQKAFSQMGSKHIPNLFKRFAGKALFVIPAFVALKMVVDWGNAQNTFAYRKEGAEFLESIGYKD